MVGQTWVFKLEKLFWKLGIRVVLCVSTSLPQWSINFIRNRFLAISFMSKKYLSKHMVGHFFQDASQTKFSKHNSDWNYTLFFYKSIWIIKCVRLFVSLKNQVGIHVKVVFMTCFVSSDVPNVRCVGELTPKAVVC